MDIRLHLVILSTVAIIIACRTVNKKKPAKDLTTLENLADFPDALYPIAVKGKWGYMNHKLEIVIPPQFSMAEDFHQGLAVVGMRPSATSQEELQGYIDTTGTLVIACRYEQASAFSEGFAAVKQKGRWGFINKSGDEVVQPVYEEVSKFSEGLAVVKINEKNGFIDSSGKMVIAPQFARACWVSDFSEGLAAVYTSEDGGGGYIDKSGTMVIPGDYSYVSGFSEGLALVQPTGSTKYGYINHQGQLVIKPRYDLSLPFSEGVASVKLSKPDGHDLFQLIDKTGKVVADDLKYAFVGIFREGLAGVESFDHRWGFIDQTGKEVIPPKFASVKLFKNGLSRIETGSLFKGLKIEYINKSGKRVWNE